MNKIIIALISACFFFGSIQAQEGNNDENNDGGFALGFVPQYTFVNGLRVDMDFRTGKNSDGWIILAPQIYYNEDENYNQSYEEMSGYGMDLYYRHYLNGNASAEGLYFNFGVTFQYFRVKEYDLVMEEFEENGATYFKYVNKLVDNDLYKVGPNLLLGYQVLIKDKLFLDFYAGPAFRKSFDNKDDMVVESYNDWWGDLAYSGILLNGGLRLGIIF